MKKILALVAILAIGLGSINAQDNLRWGVTAGMNVSSLNVTGLDSRVGFHAGVKAELGLPQFTEGLYMDFGALLSLKAPKLKQAVWLVSRSTRTIWKFRYILAINML